MSFSQLSQESEKLGLYLYPPAKADEEKSTYSTCSAVLKEVPIVPVPLRFDHIIIYTFNSAVEIKPLIL